MHPTLATTAILAAAGLVATTSSGVAVSPKLPLRLSAPQRHTIAEYDPVAEVVMSEDLFNYDYGAPLLARAVLEAGATPVIAVNDRKAAATLRRALTAADGPSAGRLTPAEVKKLRFAHVAHASIWVRDYGPVMVEETQPDGKPALIFADLVYGSSEKDNERFPTALARRMGRPSESVPLELDGGNLLAARDVCFTSTTDLTRDTYTATPVAAPAAAGPPGAPPPAADVLASAPRALGERFGATLGCKTVVVVAKPPHAHVDMWMKVIADDAVLVNEIDAATIAVVKDLYGHVPDDIAALRDDLNDKARELARYLKVDRVPMPLPYRGAFWTYTNALLVNGTAIVPSYERFGWNYGDYPDAKLRGHYEAAARAAYARHGFRTRLVKADGLIHNGGAFHCVMLQIPRLGAPIAAAGAMNHAKGH